MKEVAESKYLYADIKDEFLKKRIGTTLSWNIRKSVSNKRFYYVFSALSIIAPILVTILHSIDSEVFIAYHLQLYSVILTTVTTVSSSLMALFHFREQWKLHRKLVEQLKAELVNFHVKNNRCGEEELKALSKAVEKIILESNIENMKNLDTHLMAVKGDNIKKEELTTK